MIGLRRRQLTIASCTASMLAALITSPALGYPLDGADDTGILRLEAYRLAQTGKIRGRLLPPGARLPGDTIQLRLSEFPDFAIPAPDAAFGDAIRSLLQDDAAAYGVAVLDLTDPQHPRFAAHNTEMTQNPASVGKLMVALGWFQTLADLYPDDIAARDALMYDTQHSANAFIRSDSHDVPIWHPGDPRIDFRPLREGDRGNLWSWLDWMLSSSSNAAASSVMAELILLKHFGGAYPISPEAAKAFFRDQPKPVLSGLLRETVQKPVTRNGLDLQNLRQGSFFTREGKSRVPGITSMSTPMELLRFMVRMEQGRLVDGYSSLALKRLLYLSERRIRYASSQSLRRAAVYFKSGSWYTCKAESGFQCGKYEGNVRNFLNSVVVVETQPPARKLHYIAIVLSNVLRKNSATIHRNLATEIHSIIEAFHASGGTISETAASTTATPWADPIEEMDGEPDEFDGEPDEFDGEPDEMDGEADEMDSEADELDGQLDELEDELDELEDELDELDSEGNESDSGA